MKAGTIWKEIAVAHSRYQNLDASVPISPGISNLGEEVIGRYWEQRYKKSPAGIATVGHARDWRWKIIARYTGGLDDVIDFGCGDLGFWSGRDCLNYLGIDISERVVETNREARPGWKFIVSDSSTPLRLRARVVLCIELLCHLMEEEDFVATLDNLAACCGEWLLISTWSTNRFGSLRDAGLRALGLGTSLYRLENISRTWLDLVRAAQNEAISDGVYRTYRPLEKYLDRIAAAGLQFESKHLCPFDLGLTAMYVFRRQNFSKVP